MLKNSEMPEDLASLVQAANQRNTLRGKLSRATNILRYYRTSQLLQRAARKAIPTFLTRPLRAWALQGLPPQETCRVRQSSLEKMRSLAAARTIRIPGSLQTFCDDLSRGKLTLLQEPCELGTPIDWQGRVATHPSHLWRFHLHYQEYLLDLAVGSTAENTAKNFDAWPEIWKLLADWMHANPYDLAQLSGDAWHPYCLSRRLPVWAQLFALQEPPEDLRDAFLRSFACQAEVLSKSLEFDLGGNHLLENLRALALAGVFLDGSRSQRWLTLATRHFQKQLPAQVLPHGEHYERAAMYHCQVLGNLLQVVVATTGEREELSNLGRVTASKMYRFLQSILHPDGEIPLFGDSCWGEAHSVEEIEELAKSLELDGTSGTTVTTQPPAASAGPYWVWRHADEALIFDTGPVGANSLPAHAHCDLLGFEASIAGERWFVDSGLFDYNDSTMRVYCRSSAAHNVVTVDHQNCCDVWSRFRMGRRGRPTRFEQGQTAGFTWCQASHDGYRHLGVPEISRLIAIHASGVWTCLEHARKQNNSSLNDIPLIGRLHTAPGIQLQQLNSQQILLTKDDTQRWLTVTSNVELRLAEGWYCDRFGQRTRTQVITYSCRKNCCPKNPSNHPNNLGTTFGWSLSSSAEKTATVTIIDEATGNVELTIPGTPEVFRRQLSH